MTYPVLIGLLDHGVDVCAAPRKLGAELVSGDEAVSCQASQNRDQKDFIVIIRS